MKLFSLTHLITVAAQLPDPREAIHAERGYSTVVRLPIRDVDAVRDTDRREREPTVGETSFVEFEILPWKDSRGVTVPRWVLRGLVAI